MGHSFPSQALCQALGTREEQRTRYGGGGADWVSPPLDPSTQPRQGRSEKVLENMRKTTQTYPIHMRLTQRGCEV